MADIGLMLQSMNGAGASAEVGTAKTGKISSNQGDGEFSSVMGDMEKLQKELEGLDPEMQEEVLAQLQQWMQSGKGLPSAEKLSQWISLAKKEGVVPNLEALLKGDIKGALKLAKGNAEAATDSAKVADAGTDPALELAETDEGTERLAKGALLQLKDPKAVSELNQRFARQELAEAVRDQLKNSEDAGSSLRSVLKALGGGEQAASRLMEGGFNPGQLLAASGASTDASGLSSTAAQALMNASGANASTQTQTSQFGALQNQLMLSSGVGGKDWQEGLGDRIMWMMGRGIQSADIKLNPQHLGPMEIRISVQQDQASVVFGTNQPLVREALEQAIPRLREMLGEQNLNLAQVDVGERQDSQQRADHEGGLGNGGSGDNLLGSSAEGGESASGDAGPVSVRQTSVGLIDTYV